ncbi:hypothetical protein NMY22_g2219 [Coprinellus aureogranulatus]|nr:hypothetical protein NMY22_g2219 [Coprinellus aureogranulatus]
MNAMPQLAFQSNVTFLCLDHPCRVESSSGLPVAGKYTFRLSMKVGGIERPVCEPVQKTLRVDPRALEFVVFMFPGKSSVPTGCLWSLRVWLRVNSIDHRLFGEDELWVGKDPDFNAIGDASFARLKHQDTHEMVHHVYVGRALVLFSVKWSRVHGNLFKYSLEYEAGGVGGVVFEDVRLKLDIDPRTVSFLIFTVPSNSIPQGASHKLRVWIRTLVSLSPTARDPSLAQDAAYSLPFNDSYLYQRLFKTDDFKVGAHLQFEILGPKMIMGFSVGGPEAVRLAHPPHSGNEGGRGGGKRGHSGSVE